MKALILASTSPRRKALMEQIGLTFSIEPSDYEEDMTLVMQPAELARVLSEGKAQAVAQHHKEAIVIGSDTIVALGDRVMGKAKSTEEMKEMLQALSGQTHQVITGITAIDTATGVVDSRSVMSDVTFKKLTEPEIDAYIATGEPEGKAGAYAIQGIGAFMVLRVQGDYSGIVGLPIPTLLEMLALMGVEMWK